MSSSPTSEREPGREREIHTSIENPRKQLENVQKG
jgi:hypothetical protein